MTPSLDVDKHLVIQLLSFDRPTDMTEQYYFLEMSTLQATLLLDQDTKLDSCKIFAYSPDGKYLDEKRIASLKTIGDFNQFFLNNSDYYIHDCEISLEGQMTISSHDDGEVSIKLDSSNPDNSIIHRIFDKYKLAKGLIDSLKSNPGRYMSIDAESNILAFFETFDDYIENQKS